jgi:hypothetical protein
MVSSNSLHRGENRTASVHKKYAEVVSPHIESFDSFVRSDIRKVIDSIEPVQVRGSGNHALLVPAVVTAVLSY